MSAANERRTLMLKRLAAKAEPIITVAQFLAAVQETCAREKKSSVREKISEDVIQKSCGTGTAAQQIRIKKSFTTSQMHILLLLKRLGYSLVRKGVVRSKNKRKYKLVKR